MLMRPFEYCKIHGIPHPVFYHKVRNGEVKLIDLYGVKLVDSATVIEYNPQKNPKRSKKLKNVVVVK